MADTKPEDVTQATSEVNDQSEKPEKQELSRANWAD